MFKVKINNEVKEFETPVRVLDLLPKKEHLFFGCKVNNRLRELTYILNKDSEVEFLGLDNYDTMLIYENSLRYLMCHAVHNLFPKVLIEFDHFISQSLSCNLINYEGFVDEELIAKINAEMQRIIEADFPFKKRTVTIAEAMKIFDDHGYQDKKEVTKYRPEDTAHFYECDGYINYMFGYMVPSTGYLKRYILSLYYPQIVVQFPRSFHKGEIPEFEDSPSFTKTLRASKKWAKISNTNTIADINKHTETVEELIDFVSMCETKHNDLLCQLSDQIAKNIEDIRLINIAGPSSSGKTTFSNRLRVALMNHGIRPVRISIDNYYLGRDKCPKDEFGNPDFEHIEALDIDLFNQNMLSLIQGQEVTLPIFNFKTGKREEGERIKISLDTPIILEGIHALNDRLTALIPKYQKFKIYICPVPQIHIDRHNPVSYTDVRLLRRIVRDYKHRNSSARDTIAMWPSVRKGEFKWIYPCQDDVDFTFNSELSYEFCVMKKYALPLLAQIPPEDEHYISANRLIKFLKYFNDIDEKWVPCNSLCREFIGGSVFEDLK